MGLVSETTILPLFLSHLTDNPAAVGLVRATMYFGWLVPGILVSHWVDRLPVVRYSVVWIAVIERVAMLLMGLLCLWPGRSNPTVLLWGFFACWLVLNAAMGANTPGYFKLIAKTIPPELRGRLYGVGGALSGVVGMGAAWAGGHYLRVWGFPGGFAACFFAACVVQTLTVIPLGFMREPSGDPEASASVGPSARAIGELLRTDRRLAWLVAAAAAFAVNQMIGGLYSTFAIQRFGADDGDIAFLNTVANGARAVAFLLVGWMSDRWGNRCALILGACAGVGAAGTALVAPGENWLPAVFALSELATQAWGVCTLNYVLDLCSTARSATYTAVFMLLSVPFRAGMPLVAGSLVRAVGFQGAFLPAVVGGLAALALLLLRVVEPRSQSGLPKG